MVTEVRDHAAPMLTTAPVMPSLVIIRLLYGWDMLTVCIVTGVVEAVESKTKLQLRRKVGDCTVMATLEKYMDPPLKVLSSNDVLQPPRIDVIVVLATKTDDDPVKVVNPNQRPTYRKLIVEPEMETVLPLRVAFIKTMPLLTLSTAKPPGSSVMDDEVKVILEVKCRA